MEEPPEAMLPNSCRHCVSMATVCLPPLQEGRLKLDQA